MAGVNKEIWTGEVIKALTSQSNFMQVIKDRSSYVNNDVIHLVELPTKVNVLKNFTAYPVPTQAFTDADKQISLSKWSTEMTVIPDDRLYSISYDLLSEALESHVDALRLSSAKDALWNFAPATLASATGRFVATTGADNGSGHKRLTLADLVLLKKKFDDANIPLNDRYLVLRSDHIMDLLLLDNSFRDKYYSIENGQILTSFMGFKIYEFTDQFPVYTFASGGGGVYTRSTYLTADSTGGALHTSIAFHAANTFKAFGSTSMYYRDAASNPEYQASMIDFKQYGISLPLRPEAVCPIISVAV